jgi:biotin synthase-related radical SAM superfamily protein
MIPWELSAKKAELINYGKINIPKEITLPFYPSRSTAGPGAGARAMVFSFSDTRVKLRIVRDGSAIYSLAHRPSSAVKKDLANEGLEKTRACIQGNPYMILKNNEQFIDEVAIEPTIMHAPCQAFINITSECIYNCSFCVTPALDVGRKSCSVDRWIELILAHANNSNLKAVSITSGVSVSPHDTIEDMVRIITAVRAELPEIPIGVEPYVTDKDDIELLYNAGATEIKINLEAPTQELFDKVCPGMDYSGIRAALTQAVSFFGRNKVCSNLIIGLGESDEELLSAVEFLAELGVVATLRALRVNDMNKQKLTDSLGFTPEPVPVERLLKLAKEQKTILDKFDLTTRDFDTMCHNCKSCDIVPQQDV